MHLRMRETEREAGMRKFWNDVNECLMKIGRGSMVGLIGYMNGRVGNSKVAGVMRKAVIDGMNDNGDYLVDMCEKGNILLSKHLLFSI